MRKTIDRVTVRCGLIVLAMGLLAAPAAMGQASLAAENIIDEITDDEGNAYTCFQDANDEKQWYYLPTTPRLTWRPVEEARQEQFPNGLPELSLLRYQRTDSSNRQTILNDGYLQFACTFAAPKGVVEILKAKVAETIEDRGGDAGGLRLSAMPLKDARVTMYSMDGDLISNSPMADGFAVAAATSKLAFAMALSGSGADVYDAMINSTTGIPVAMTYTYVGLTTPAKVRIDVDWSKAETHFSSSTSTARKQVGYWIVGKTTREKNESLERVYETMKSNQSIKITQIGNAEAVSPEEQSAFVQGLLPMILKKLLDLDTPPEKIDAAKAEKAVANERANHFYNDDYVKNIAVKDIRKFASNTQTYEMTWQMPVDRVNTAVGFIGIGNLAQEVKDECVTFVDTNNWQQAYFLLPNVGDSPDMNTQSVVMTTKLVIDGDEVDSQVTTWAPGSYDRNDNWTGPHWWYSDAEGGKQNCTRVAFPLASWTASPKYTEDDVKEAKFRTTTTITYTPAGVTKAISLTQDLEMDVFSGEAPVSPPMQMTRAVVVDGSWLDFVGARSEDPGVGRVVLTLKSGRDQYSVTLGLNRSGDLIDGTVFLFKTGDDGDAKVSGSLVITMLNPKETLKVDVDVDSDFLFLDEYVPYPWPE